MATLFERIQAVTQARYIRASAAAGHKGPEYHGPCPDCGGRDRLCVWPEDPNGAWAWCRRCGTTFHDDWRLPRDNTPAAAIDRPITPPEPCLPPPQAWQDHYYSLLRVWQKNLLAGSYHAPIDYLYSRGMTMTTILAAGLGYNHDDHYDDTHGWIPAGITIPWLIDDQLWRVSIRRSDRQCQRDKRGKYINLRGSSNALYGAAGLANKPAIIVEGAFDQMAILQTAGDLIAPVAAGATGARRLEWYARFIACPIILLGFDNDAAGLAASRFWQDIFQNRAIPWPSLRKDYSEMLQHQIDIRSWIIAGLQQAVQTQKGDPCILAGLD